jgi:DNA-binding MarR family transcriptional regulator
LWRYDNDVLAKYADVQRLVSLLLYYLNEHHPAGNLIPIRQKNIASLIAINQTNMSRNIKKLKDSGLVIVSGSGIQVLDAEGLKAYLV